MSSLTRRSFLQASAAASMASVSGWPTARGDVIGSNDRIHVGVIGCGIRGRTLIGNLPPSARVTALCDCDTRRIDQTRNPTGEEAEELASFAERDADSCATYQDDRALLDDTSLDAVIIAAPDHHHVRAAMMALQAGLDVYLEKPLSLYIREGRLLADAVQKTGRVLQVGSQQRTMELNRFACEFVRDGGLGKVHRIELSNYPGPRTAPAYDAQQTPAALDWQQFLGPTVSRPYHRKLCMKDVFKVGELAWRGWDFWKDFSGHLMTNWGAHSVDMVQYALGEDTSGPVSIEPLPFGELATDWKQWAKKTTPPDGQDDHRFRPVRMTYASGVQVDFVLGPDRIHIYGERGMMKTKRNFYEVDPPELVTNPPDPSLAERWKGHRQVARPHLENWLDCVRTRKTPNAPVEFGHRTATVCHLANIARELGRPLRWNPQEERFIDDAKADTMLDRPRRKGFELPVI